MKILKLPVVLTVLLLSACASKSNDNLSNQTTPVNHIVVQEESNKHKSPIYADGMYADNSNFADINVVYFAFDTATPSSDEEDKAIKQAEWLRTHNFRLVIIEGYTDIYGTREYNLALGEKRANAIKDILVKNGVPSKKIKVVSYGKEYLADKHNQAHNRRTVTKVEN